MATEGNESLKIQNSHSSKVHKAFGVENSVHKILNTELRNYLLTNLVVDADLIFKLRENRLISTEDFEGLRIRVEREESQEAVGYLVRYMKSFYTEEMLERLCTVLETSVAKPIYLKVAERLRKEMKLCKPRLLPLTVKQQDAPSTSGSVSSSPAIQGASDERTDKIKEIVDKYRNGEGSLYLPFNPQLEDEFDTILGQLYAAVSAVDPQMIMKLYGILRVKYRRYFHGARPVPLPSIPETAKGLCDFIADKSTPYEVFLVHHAVQVLGDEDLKTALKSYESKLSQHMISTLLSYKSRRITLPLRADHTHMAVVVSKEQVLLALVLHLKEYFTEYLQLEETLFEGFEEGCIVLFFSILKEDTALLAPKVLPHLAELNKVFNITHLIVFGYFVCNLDKVTIEPFDNSYKPMYGSPEQRCLHKRRVRPIASIA